LYNNPAENVKQNLRPFSFRPLREVPKYTL
jgi:hypothetical protein